MREVGKVINRMDMDFILPLKRNMQAVGSMVFRMVMVDVCGNEPAPCTLAGGQMTSETEKGVMRRVPLVNM
jgi:hypothetical protein